MSNELTAVRQDSPQPPLPVPAPRPPAEAVDLRVDVLSIAPLVVGVSGEIDIASAPKLREELLGALRRHGTRLALDLGGVTFMDCAGINALLAAWRHARLEGGWVRVARASRRADNILMLTGLHRELALAVVRRDEFGGDAPSNRVSGHHGGEHDGCTGEHRAAAGH